MIKSKKELDFYLKADRMMNRGVFEFSLLQRIKNVFFPDWVMRYLSSMRKASYYETAGGGIILF